MCYLLQDKKTVELEFGNLLGIPDNYPEILVRLDKAYTTGSFKGITHYYLKDFLIREENMVKEVINPVIHPGQPKLINFTNLAGF